MYVLIFTAYFYMTSLGLLHTKIPLDRETREAYSFRVVASDGKLTGSALVQVTVLDQNDNPPIFTQEIGTYTIDEAQANDNIVQVSHRSKV